MIGVTTHKSHPLSAHSVEYGAASTTVHPCCRFRTMFRTSWVSSDMVSERLESVSDTCNACISLLRCWSVVPHPCGRGDLDLHKSATDSRSHSEVQTAMTTGKPHCLRNASWRTKQRKCPALETARLNYVVFN